MFLDHINRYVSDVNAMIAFYTEALGFKLLDQGVKKDGNNYAILSANGFELFISEKDDFELVLDCNFRHIGLTVASADTALATLKAKGYVPKGEQLIIKAFSRQFYLRDPDGFEIDLIEWTDKERFYRYLKDKNATDSH